MCPPPLYLETRGDTSPRACVFPYNDTRGDTNPSPLLKRFGLHPPEGRLTSTFTGKSKSIRGRRGWRLKWPSGASGPPQVAGVYFLRSRLATSPLLSSQTAGSPRNILAGLGWLAFNGYFNRYFYLLVKPATRDCLKKYIDLESAFVLRIRR